MKMSLEEIITKYRSQFQRESVAEEIKVSIQHITYNEYENFYREKYENFMANNVYMFNYKNATLKEMNDFFYNRELSIMFDEDSCIFNESDEYISDFDFFEEINNSEFIKAMMVDEKAEHGVRDEGHLLSSLIGSICQQKFYQNEIFNPIDMYATTWWKLNTTHPFRNGNKRTSFIGVKSKMFSAILLHFITLSINYNKNSVNELFESEVFKNEYLPKIIKKINYWKKPTVEQSLDFIKKEFMVNFDSDVWNEISENEKITTMVNNVVQDITKSVSKQISDDYILSIFIAKIHGDEYKKDDGFVKDKVIEILKADLIISIINNIDYIYTRIEILKNEINLILKDFGPNRFKNQITQKLKNNEI